jgi:hypothetical protein
LDEFSVGVDGDFEVLIEEWDEDFNITLVGMKHMDRVEVIM